ncbi:hypothetical protein K438DRAFT_2029121 [Mycena galopus ATCC 62051]|nr:hypothetical protein K438DRAFT_2029121 [Mycena galopus ATCC 62051]
MCWIVPPAAVTDREQPHHLHASQTARLYVPCPRLHSRTTPSSAPARVLFAYLRPPAPTLPPYSDALADDVSSPLRVCIHRLRLPRLRPIAAPILEDRQILPRVQSAPRQPAAPHTSRTDVISLRSPLHCGPDGVPVSQHPHRPTSVAFREDASSLDTAQPPTSRLPPSVSHAVTDSPPHRSRAPRCPGASRLFH